MWPTLFAGEQANDVTPDSSATEPAHQCGRLCFCANPTCSTGYVSANEVIPKSELRAFQSGQPAMLCHCFDISEATYRAALQAGGAEQIKSFIVQQTKGKLCACESRNLSGRCCLAGFKQMEKAHDC